MVELDFSWNRLQFVPLAQIGRMSLLRKLSMRGNPLKSLTESTFSTQRAAPTLLGSDDLAADPAQEQRAPAAATNLSRLYESFPGLARALLRRQPLLAQRKSPSSSSAGGKSNDDDDSFIIEQMELEVLESIVRQHEQIGAADDAEAEADADETVADDSSELENDIDANSQDDNSSDDRRAKSARPANREADFARPGAANELDRAEKGASSAQRRAKSRSLSSASSSASAKGLGGHFSQLQELDFGRCQLTYIKWSVFDQLDQLKRLHLDGNQLR